MKSRITSAELYDEKIKMGEMMVPGLWAHLLGLYKGLPVKCYVSTCEFSLPECTGSHVSTSWVILHLI